MAMVCDASNYIEETGHCGKSIMRKKNIASFDRLCPQKDFTNLVRYKLNDIQCTSAAICIFGAA